MLTDPILAKCGDRTSMPQLHPTSGSPENWFSNSILTQRDFYGITFDFFVNWSIYPNNITNIIWVKKILIQEFSYLDVLDNLNNVFENEIGMEYLYRLVSFAQKFKFIVQFVIFRDDYDWSIDTNEILIVTVSLNTTNNFIYEHEIITLEKFKSLIISYSGGPITIGSKGLTYGTSKLECYLSKTNSLYPGDVDLIILDNNNSPIALLEFKKHTLPITINKQGISNYYPNPDGRKYDRLAILADYISIESVKIPFFVVYYPTRKELVEGKLELLSRDSKGLTTNISSNFQLPNDNSEDGFLKIADKLKKAINYYYGLTK